MIDSSTRQNLIKLSRRLAEDEIARKRYGEKYPKASNAIRPVLDNPNVIQYRGFVLTEIRKRLGQLSVQKDVPLHYRTRDVLINTKYSKSTREQKTLRIPPKYCATTDIFGGAGLFSYAAKISRCKTVDVLEKEGFAVDTFNANHLAEIKVVPNLAEEWSPVIPVQENIDLLMGGPPCKPFSRANELGHRTKGRGITAQDNYFSWTLDWLADLCPRALCLENVLEFERNEENADYIRWYLDQLEYLGYQGQNWHLNAADYGTPQMRRRLFIVATPIGAPWTPLIQSPKPSFQEPGQAENLPPWISAGEAISTGCLKGFGKIFCKNTGNYQGKCLNCTRTTGSSRKPSNFEQAPNSTGEFARKTTLKGLSRGNVPLVQYMKKPLSPIRPDQPRIRKFTPIDQSSQRPYSKKRKSEYLSRTITTFSFDMVERMLIPKGQDTTLPQSELLENDRLHLINFRDLTKLQDVPNHFIFKGSKSSIVKQPGLGVPILLGKAVIQTITRPLLEGR